MARDDQTGKFITQNLSDAKSFSKAISEDIKEMGPLLAALTGQYGMQKKLLGEIKDELDGNSKISKKELEAFGESANLAGDKAHAINEIAPGMMSMAKSAASTAQAFGTLLGPVGGIVVAVLAIGKAFLEFQKQVTDTRKELGVSYGQAVAITAQNKVLAQVAKGYGLDIADITSAQAAIRNDLGASVQESVKLSLNFARTAAATGQTSEELTGTLSIMESISSASRDVLLNQIRTNAAIIGQAGVSPALVMKDLASNAEFFAQFAKDGGSNIIQAGIAARKLGLEMSAVAGISESLLDFETSIEKQMEASLLIGRQINLDRARQLMFVGKTDQALQEVLKQVGSEAEFTKMLPIARKALAESVGVNVEQLSRLVRNNTAGATGAAAGAAAAGAQATQSSDMRAHELLGKIVRNTE